MRERGAREGCAARASFSKLAPSFSATMCSRGAMTARLRGWNLNLAQREASGSMTLQ